MTTLKVTLVTNGLVKRPYGQPLSDHVERDHISQIIGTIDPEYGQVSCLLVWCMVRR